MSVDRKEITRLSSWAGVYDVKTIKEELDFFGYIVFLNPDAKEGSDFKLGVIFIDADDVAALTAVGHWIAALTSGHGLNVTITDKQTDLWGPHTPTLEGFVLQA